MAKGKRGRSQGSATDKGRVRTRGTNARPRRGDAPRAETPREFDVEIKNYRCFTDERPARLRLRPGFTALIGPNNSGKSSILKALYDMRRTAEALVTPNGLASALGGAGQFMSRQHVLPESDDRNFTRLNGRPLGLAVRLGAVTGRSGLPVADELVVEFPRHAHAAVTTVVAAGGARVWDNSQLSGPGEDGILRTADTRQLADLGLLRAAVRDLAQCRFIGPFRNALNMQPSDRYYDIQVGVGFIQSWHRLKNHPDPKGNAAAHRVTDDIRRIFRLETLDINASADGSTLMVYRNGTAHKLEELGSGLAQFILTIANAAIQEPSYLLVDEPELNLHPSLQVDFLTTLGSYARRGVVFATHSLGLARAVADAIYTVRQRPDGVSEIRDFEATGELPELLGELCFAGYRDLGFKTVLLVEGATDIKTMQQFLRRWGKDHEMVVLPLGGSGMINGDRDHELAEVKRIAERVIAVIDSERDHEGATLAGDREAFRALCGRLGIDCHVLQRRALDNYISDRAVKLVKGEKYRALQPHERLRDLDPAWAKPEGWRIAREMEAAELKGTDLHAILESL